MTFARQIALFVSLALGIALVAQWVLTVHEMRGYLSRQLESHARDAARSLGLSISLHLADGDTIFAESIVDSLFDSGDYESIRVLDLDGAARIERERAPRPPDVPEWFARWLTIDAPQSSSELTAGWRRVGGVTVRSHPGYAYEQLVSLEADGDRVEAVNVGAVIHTGADAAEMLIEKCEEALRNAEGSGAGHSHVWRASEAVQADALHDEAHWEALLKHAIAGRHVVLEAQPVVASDGETMLHHEVLARFREEDGTLVPAARFIPVAVRLGLGASLDVVIVEQVLDVLATRFQSDERLAVNLSGAAAGDSDFVRWLGARLAREPRARCERLCLEVMEHFALGFDAAQGYRVGRPEPLI